MLTNDKDDQNEVILESILNHTNEGGFAMNVFKIILLFSILFCLKGVAVASMRNVRQPVCDVSAFVTLDFSGFWRVRIPNDKRLAYEDGLLALFNSRIGVYQSECLGESSVIEWQGIHKLQLTVDNSARATMQPLDRAGRAMPIPSWGHGFISESSIFLGSHEAGYLFLYALHSNIIYTLFSPNGVQIPIRFTKIADMPKAKSLPRPREGLEEAIDFQQRIYERDLNKHFISLRGWYKCLTPPNALQFGDVNEYYLKINGFNDYIPLMRRHDCYWYDDNLFDMICLDRLNGPYGRYAFDGTFLRFVRPPPASNVLDLIRLKILLADGKTRSAEYLKVQIERSDAIVANEISLYWAKGNIDARRTVFKKVNRPDVTVNNLRICRHLKDVTSTNYVESLVKESLK